MKTWIILSLTAYPVGLAWENRWDLHPLSIVLWTLLRLDLIKSRWWLWFSGFRQRTFK